MANLPGVANAVADWLGQIFLQVASNGLPLLPTQAQLNFLDPLQAALNAANGSIDVTLAAVPYRVLTAPPSPALAPIDQKLAVNSKVQGPFGLPLPLPAATAFQINVTDTGLYCATAKVTVQGISGLAGIPVECPDGPNAGKLAASYDITTNGASITWRQVTDPLSKFWSQTPGDGGFPNIYGGTFWKVVGSGQIATSLSAPLQRATTLTAASQAVNVNSRLLGAFPLTFPSATILSSPFAIDISDTGKYWGTAPDSNSANGYGVTMLAPPGVRLENPSGPNAGLLTSSFTCGWLPGWSERFGPTIRSGGNVTWTLWNDPTNGLFYKVS